MKSKNTWQIIFVALCVPLTVWALSSVVDLPAPSFIQKRAHLAYDTIPDDPQDVFSPASLLNRIMGKNSPKQEAAKTIKKSNQLGKLVTPLDIDGNGPKTIVPEQEDEVYSPVEKFKLSDRPMTDEQTSAIYQDLLRAPEPYPFEFDQELYDLSQKIKSGTILPHEMDRYLEQSSTYQERNRKEPNPNTAYDDSSYGFKSNGPSVRGHHPQSVKSAIYASQRNSAFEGHADSDTEFSDVSSRFSSGYAQTYVAVDYTGKAHNPISKEFQYTHENLRIHHAVKGQRATAFVQGLSTFKTPVYLSKAGFEPAMHDRYRIGPDWNNHWSFDGKNKEKLELAIDQHVMSLGKDGSIVFEITDGEITNGEGPDFVIWSNPFCYIQDEETKAGIKEELNKYRLEFIPFDGNAKSALAEKIPCFTELAIVEVSMTGAEDSYRRFPCEKDESKRSHCAGYGFNFWHQSKNPRSINSGGDRFDLEDVGLETANFIRITDLNVPPPSTIPKEDRHRYIENGFDLDAIAILHYQGE